MHEIFEIMTKMSHFLIDFFKIFCEIIEIFNLNIRDFILNVWDFDQNVWYFDQNDRDLDQKNRNWQKCLGFRPNAHDFDKVVLVYD